MPQVEVWLAYSEPVFSMPSDEYWSWRFGGADIWNTKTLGPLTFILESEDIQLSQFKVLLGRCEAEPKAVARLAGVREAIATNALSHLGKPIFLGELRIVDLPSIVFGCYLVVCQA